MQKFTKWKKKFLKVRSINYRLMLWNYLDLDWRTTTDIFLLYTCSIYFTLVYNQLHVNVSWLFLCIDLLCVILVCIRVLLPRYQEKWESSMSDITGDTASVGGPPDLLTNNIDPGVYRKHPRASNGASQVRWYKERNSYQVHLISIFLFCLYGRG